jgi:hypothetical protein
VKKIKMATFLQDGMDGKAGLIFGEYAFILAG